VDQYLSSTKHQWRLSSYCRSRKSWSYSPLWQRQWPNRCRTEINHVTVSDNTTRRIIRLASVIVDVLDKFQLLIHGGSPIKMHGSP